MRDQGCRDLHVAARSLALASGLLISGAAHAGVERIEGYSDPDRGLIPLHVVVAEGYGLRELPAVPDAPAAALPGAQRLALDPSSGLIAAACPIAALTTHRHRAALAPPAPRAHTVHGGTARRRPPQRMRVPDRRMRGAESRTSAGTLEP